MKLRNIKKGTNGTLKSEKKKKYFKLSLNHHLPQIFILKINLHHESSSSIAESSEEVHVSPGWEVFWSLIRTTG